MEFRRDEARREAGGYSGSLLAWFVLLGLGLAMMAGYANTPGAMGAAGPAGTVFVPDGDRPALVVGLHPRCTCSVATLRELGRLLAGATVRPRVEVLLYRPASAAEGWDRTAFDEEIRSLQGVTVRKDVEGRIAQSLGMLTSGDVALFSPSGRVLFRGGVTRARGHEGESEGGRQLRQALSAGDLPAGASPVFGCPLGATR